MFDDLDVIDLCTQIKEAFYKGEEYKEHYITLCLELQDRLANTFVSTNT